MSNIHYLCEQIHYSERLQWLKRLKKWETVEATGSVETKKVIPKATTGYIWLIKDFV